MSYTHKNLSYNHFQLKSNPIPRANGFILITLRTLLSVPFVPFIILFCHVIESHDMSDVASLHDFLASIEPAPKVSEAAAEMYRLLQVLYSVALRYIEFHTSDCAVHRMQMYAELNPDLTSVGVPPVFLEHCHQQQSSNSRFSENK